MKNLLLAIIALTSVSLVSCKKDNPAIQYSHTVPPIADPSDTMLSSWSFEHKVYTEDTLHFPTYHTTWNSTNNYLSVVGSSGVWGTGSYGTSIIEIHFKSKPTHAGTYIPYESIPYRDSLCYITSEVVIPNEQTTWQTYDSTHATVSVAVNSAGKIIVNFVGINFINYGNQNTQYPYITQLSGEIVEE